MILLSIIIPTFNSELSIYNCLQSILNQTFENYEIIIIDGKSTDRTIEVIEGLNNNKISILSEPDNGIYDAMNKGIKLAKGDWLYFIGSDDSLYNTSVLQNVSKYLISRYQFVYGNVLLKNKNFIYDGSFSAFKLMHKNICHQAIFYHKSIFENIGLFETKYVIYADYVFNIKCFTKEKVKKKYINLIIAVYNIGGFSFNNSKDTFYFNEKIKIYKSFPKHLRLLFSIFHKLNISPYKQKHQYVLNCKNNQ